MTNNEEVLRLQPHPPADGEPLPALSIAELLASLPLNALAREEHLRRRISAERARRGWSQQELQRRLRTVGGYPLSQSSISKIENPAEGTAPRSISVDEAVAFATVFEIPLMDLLSPTGEYQRQAIEDYLRGPSALKTLDDARQDYEELVRVVAQSLLDGSDSLRGVLRTEIRQQFALFGVDSLNAFREALTHLDDFDLEGEARLVARFSRDVLDAAERQEPVVRRPRGKRKGSR